MWIARDKDGHLVLFTKDKPIRSLNDWQDQNNSATWVYIDDCYAPMLTWEDEPIEVKLVSKSIDEKKLEQLVTKYASEIPFGERVWYDETNREVCNTGEISKAFKEGYCKAMEEQL